MSNEGVSLLLVLAGITVYLVWDTYVEGKTESVKSTVDGQNYVVRSLPDRQQASDLLAQIRAKLQSLAAHLEKMSPEDPRTQLIVQNFKGDKIMESKDDSGKYTSYSINKGEKIVFCLRSRQEGNKLMDLNTMMFVALHELAHIATTEVGHTPMFWDNFRWLLEEAIQVGVYREQDFKSKPVPYCGIVIHESPLHRG